MTGKKFENLRFLNICCKSGLFHKKMSDNDKIFRVAGFMKLNPRTTISQSAVELIVEMPVTQAICNFGQKMENKIFILIFFHPPALIMEEPCSRNKDLSGCYIIETEGNLNKVQNV